MNRFAVEIGGVDLDDDLGLEDRVCLRQLDPVLPVPPLERQTAQRDDLPPLTSTECRLDILGMQDLVDKMHENASLTIFNSLAVPSTQIPVSVRQRQRDVRVFCNFLATQGKKHVVTLRLKDLAPRGVDVIDQTIKAFLCDERLKAMYSDNPRLYRLFMADDSTGEEEVPIQHDSACGNFTCFALAPLPAAQIFLFPKKGGLLPPPAEDPIVYVEVKDGVKSSRRLVTLPLDLAVNHLEAYLSERLTNHSITPGTVKIRYGPMDLHLSEVYNFGPGCGAHDVPVGDLTVYSCTRFGVAEYSAHGRVNDEEADPIANVDGALDHLRRMDEEEARAYQQFDVIKVNKFGVRQQRVIGVDGERVYNMRPLSEVGKTKNPERLIEDIEVVRDFRERPTYCEIEYNKASKYDTDRIDCRNSADCIMLVEKLRMLKKIHGRRDIKRTDTTLSRFFSRFGFGK
jgi:hypothetical protein